jgi:hypothetical protein
MKLSLLPIILLRLEASSASPPQRIRSADRDTTKASATKAATTTAKAPLSAGHDHDSRRRLLEMSSDYFSMSYGSVPLSYDFSMSYPTGVEASDLDDDLPSTDSTTTTTTTTTTIPTTAATTTTITDATEEDTETMRVVDDADELPSTTSTSVPENAPVDGPTEGTTIHDAHQQVPGGGSSIRNMAPLIAVAGGLAAMSLLVTGLYRMKKAKNGTQDGIIHPDEKSIDGQSTVNRTIDSTSLVESVEMGEMLPTRASVQNQDCQFVTSRISFLERSHLAWQ